MSILPTFILPKNILTALRRPANHIQVSPLHVWVANLEEGVDVAVFLLSGLDDINCRIQIGTHGRVIANGQRIGRSLGKLVDVAIVKPESFKIAGALSCRSFEIGQSAGVDELLELSGERYFDENLLPSAPKGIGYLDIGEGKTAHTALKRHA